MTDPQMTKLNTRIEAAQEFKEFIDKVEQHKLQKILTGDALMLVFIALGRKMWERNDD